MIMNLIMTCTMLPTMLIVVAVFYFMGKEKDRYVFGVTLSKEQRKSDEVTQIEKQYKKEFWLLFGTTIWLPLLAFLTSYVSIQFTIWMLWFLMELVIFLVPYIRANKRTLALKTEDTEEEEHISYIELLDVRVVKVTTFLLPVLLSVVLPVLPFIVKGKDYMAESVTAIACGLCTVLIALAAYWLDSKKTRVVNEDSTMNLNYARATKSLWKKLWFGLAWINTGLVAAYVTATMCNFYPTPVLLVACVIETVVGMGMCIHTMLEKRSVEDAYEEHFAIAQKSDADKYWKWGMFYYNKKDKRTMVEKRYGIGMATNMASKWGLCSTMIAVVALAWIPFFCIYMIKADFTPMKLLKDEEKIVCRHMRDEYEIYLDNIEEIELVYELPKKRQKNHGTNTDSMEKGSFKTQEMGNFYEFVSLEQGIYLKITTKSGIYYVNDVNADETRKLYEQVRLTL